jgi:hypothetical protein
MWTGFERRVCAGGEIQVPVKLTGRVVLVMVDLDKPVCGSPESPHVRSLEPGKQHRCHICEVILPPGKQAEPCGHDNESCTATFCEMDSPGQSPDKGEV